MKMKKEITVTLNENSHKHAEMIIAVIGNTELVIFCEVIDHENEDGNYWAISSLSTLASCNNNFFVCHPKHKEECLHWLNGGDVENTALEVAALKITPFYQSGWHVNHPFMNPEAELRIKQEPEYVKVDDLYSISRDVEYYTINGDDYELIDGCRDIAEHFSNHMLYRKVEK